MALRGAAIMGVALGHFLGNGKWSLGVLASKGATSYAYHTERFEWWRSLVEIVTPLIGENFVLLFFVQSGYLMGKVFAEKRYDVSTQKKQFFLARFLRLAPLLYFNLLVCLWLFPYSTHTMAATVGDFLFITNFTGRSINLVTWSLSHEMQYYLLAPFAFLAFRSARLPALLAVLASIVVAHELPRYLPFLDPFRYLYVFLAGFAVNLFLANFPLTLSHAQKQWGLVGGILALHMGFNALFLFGHAAAANVLTVAVSVVLVAVCEAQSLPERGTNSGLLRFAILMGYLTYGFYLWHYPLMQLYFPTLEAWTTAISAALTLPLGLSILLYHGLGLALVGLPTLAITLVTFVFIETKFRPNLYSNLMQARRARAAG